MQVNTLVDTDILAEIGGITSTEDARTLVNAKCDDENRAKFATITNEDAVLKIANAVATMKPEAVWFNGSGPEDHAHVASKALEAGEEFQLKLPGHTCHYDLPEEQGRLVNQTFYIVDEDEHISSLAKKQPRAEAHDYLANNMAGLMAGKTMLVAFWNRGPVGAAPSVPAIMITDSNYVIHSGNILYLSLIHI